MIVEPQISASVNAALSAEAVLAAWHELQVARIEPDPERSGLSEPPLYMTEYLSPEELELIEECDRARRSARSRQIDAELEQAKSARADRDVANAGAYSAPTIGLGESQVEPPRASAVECLTTEQIAALMQPTLRPLGHGGGSKGRVRKKIVGGGGEVCSGGGRSALMADSRFTARGLSRGVHEFYAQRPNEYAVDVLTEYVDRLTAPPELTCSIAADPGARSLEIYGLSSATISTLKITRGVARIVLIEHVIAKDAAFLRRRDGRLPTIAPLTSLARAC